MMKRLTQILAAGMVAVLAPAALAASSVSLFTNPATSTFKSGQTITVAMRVNTGSNAVNALDVTLNYPADKLTFKGLDNNGTAFGLAVSGDGGNGQVHVIKGINPGSTPPSGDLQITNVIFTATTAGSATYTYAAGAQVLRSSDSSNIFTTSAPPSATAAPAATGSTSKTVTASPTPGGNSSGSYGSSGSSVDNGTAATPTPAASPTYISASHGRIIVVSSAIGFLSLFMLSYVIWMHYRSRKINTTPKPPTAPPAI